MTRTINLLAQLALGAGQVANILAPAMSEKQKLYTAGGIGAFQLLVSALASSFNPDGTSAKVAYEPQK
jgi:hypothetical protein